MQFISAQPNFCQRVYQSSGRAGVHLATAAQSMDAILIDDHSLIPKAVAQATPRDLESAMVTAMTAWETPPKLKPAR